MLLCLDTWCMLFAVCSVAKLWATYQEPTTTFLDRALASVEHTFPSKSKQFKADFSQAIQRGIAGKNAGDLRTCVNLAIASVPAP